MKKSNIAIITDSSCDIPRDYIEQHHIFILPLNINMPDGQYLDGVDITPDEVYAVMPKVIPSTSQPSPGYIMQVFEQIKEEGYQEAIAICMSSGLSGTYGVIQMCAKETEGLTVHVVDSHRLSMALGLLVIKAIEMNEKGHSATEIVVSLNEDWKKANGFFCIPSLSYLIKGGRIGLVMGTLGTLLRIIPVISINNEEGCYFTYAKTRSYSLSIKKIQETIKAIVKDKMFDIAVLQGGALEQAKKVYSSLENIEGLRNIYMCHISPALGVHAGPGLLGVAYRIID
ncbi:MAG: DegV family protein [Bacillota bacterium]|nr:DegV family protein [Bacillota bacterium]